MLLKIPLSGVSGIYGGLGYIAGIAPGILTVAGSPASRPVKLFERTTMRFIQSQWSGADGSYRFDGLSPDHRFVVIGFDHELVFNAVIRDNIQPVVP